MNSFTNLTSSWEITRNAVNFERMDIGLFGGCGIHGKLVVSMRAYAKTYFTFYIPARKPVEVWTYLFYALDNGVWILHSITTFLTLYALYIVAKYQRR